MLYSTFLICSLEGKRGDHATLLFVSLGHSQLRTFCSKCKCLLLNHPRKWKVELEILNSFKAIVLISSEIFHPSFPAYTLEE